MPSTSLPRRARIALALLVLLTPVLTACAAQLSAGPGSDRSQPSDRTDCGAIMGTAFQSESERQWFLDNCSKWPLLDIADPPDAGSAQQQPQIDPACAAMRGKPYANDDDRRWYLQNCQGQPGLTQPNQPSPTPSAQDANDRRDCNAIRG